MCGFAGFIDKKSYAVSSTAILRAMGDSISHRGPDDEGIWSMKSHGLGLIHRRLSVIDLSPGGHQPMHSRTGRYVIAYNGEIYNYKTIRSELEKGGLYFSTESDTEVLLASIETWGLEHGLKRLAGMFAFALVDLKEQILHLARDRMGEKPLYYGCQNGVFLFGSELKSMRMHPEWRGGVDLGAVSQMLQLSYIPSPNTIYPNIFKLSPGSMVSVSFHGGRLGEPVHSVWWAYEEMIRLNSGYYTGASVPEMESDLEEVLARVIAEQKVADVPLGAFLSGGIDSSLIVATMQEISRRPIRTFSIGYQDPEYDESGIASRVAAILGTDHQSWTVSPADVLAVIPKLCEIYDEPFADSSQLPTILVSKLASRDVTVALSGDGGDELFGGYNRYKWAPILHSRFSWLPISTRRLLIEGISVFNRFTEGGNENLWAKLLWRGMKVPQFSNKLDKIARILLLNDEKEIYRALTYETIGERLTLGSDGGLYSKRGENAWNLGSTFSERMMNLDAVTYLPDDILVKVDRAAMASSLEVRAPFLDHRIVEFAAKLPVTAKISRGRKKWILRQLLTDKIPPEIINRPKAGFALPIGNWLRGPLCSWAEDLLSESNLRITKCLNVELTRELWAQHLHREKNNSGILWNVLMFQSWFHHYERK